MKCSFVSYCKCIRMESSLRLCHLENGKVAPLGWSPVWCLLQRLRCQSQYKEAFRKYQSIRITSSALRGVYLPCIGAVRALYMFPQPLAVVVVNVALKPLLATPYA